jgi:hypothetical protein
MRRSLPQRRRHGELKNVRRFGVPIFVEFREPTCAFDVGLRVLEIPAAIAEVRFEVSPILRLARSREFFMPTRSRVRKVCAIHRNDRRFFRQTRVTVAGGGHEGRDVARIVFGRPTRSVGTLKGVKRIHSLPGVQ